MNQPPTHYYGVPLPTTLEELVSVKETQTTGWFCYMALCIYYHRPPREIYQAHNLGIMEAIFPDFGKLVTWLFFKGENNLPTAQEFEDQIILLELLR